MAPDHGLRIAEPELGVIAAFLHLEAKTATLGEAAEDAQELVWLPNFSIRTKLSDYQRRQPSQSFHCSVTSAGVIQMS